MWQKFTIEQRYCEIVVSNAVRFLSGISVESNILYRVASFAVKIINHTERMCVAFQKEIIAQLHTVTEFFQTCVFNVTK